jgi:hypothetical protein
MPKTPWLQRVGYVGHVVAIGEFSVTNDEVIVSNIRQVLAALRSKGRQLLDTMPKTDAPEWEAWYSEGAAWATAMNMALQTTDHFEPGDGTWHHFASPGATLEEDAQRIVRFRLDLLNQIDKRFQ